MGDPLTSLSGGVVELRVSSGIMVSSLILPAPRFSRPLASSSVASPRLSGQHEMPRVISARTTTAVAMTTLPNSNDTDDEHKNAEDEGDCYVWIEHY